ncbi:MAG: tetratricopeptide repeat protein, partial [Muribaculaceae bacterium]|nr:tetratricopeptide repeat protein [Muribaculaceae bacterium]
PSDTSQAAKDMLKEGLTQMELVSKMGSERPQLAARANYNLGNVAFDSEDYENALNFYKQSLRLNPDDASAKRNLRITQLKLQDKNKDKDQDKNQDKNQDQNKDQNKDQNQNKPQNQNQDQNQDNKQDKRQQPDINQQTADQILKAMENKENQTRARVNAGNQGDKSSGGNRSRKNW